MALFRCGGGSDNPVTKAVIEFSFVMKVAVSNGVAAEVSGTTKTRTYTNTLTVSNLDGTPSYSLSKDSNIGTTDAKYFHGGSYNGTSYGNGRCNSLTINSITLTFKDGSTITL